MARRKQQSKRFRDLQKKVRKLLSAPSSSPVSRKNVEKVSIDLPDDGYPTQAQCGGTVRGKMSRPEPIRRRKKHWNVYDD